MAARYTRQTPRQSIHDDKPWLELLQEVIVYGVSRRVTFKPRADSSRAPTAVSCR